MEAISSISDQEHPRNDTLTTSEKFAGNMSTQSLAVSLFAIG